MRVQKLSNVKGRKPWWVTRAAYKDRHSAVDFLADHTGLSRFFIDERARDGKLIITWDGDEWRIIE